jgi:hypothetical protein
MELKKFEYKNIEIDIRSYYDTRLKNVRLDEKFNELGKEGWELVAAAEYNSGGLLKCIIYTFKRIKI